MIMVQSITNGNLGIGCGLLALLRNFRANGIVEVEMIETSRQRDEESHVRIHRNAKSWQVAVAGRMRHSNSSEPELAILKLNSTTASKNAFANATMANDGHA